MARIIDDIVDDIVDDDDENDQHDKLMIVPYVILFFLISPSGSMPYEY